MHGVKCFALYMVTWKKTKLCGRPWWCAMAASLSQDLCGKLSPAWCQLCPLKARSQVAVMFASYMVTWKKDRVVWEALVVRYGSQPVTRLVWKTITSPTSAVSFEGTQPGRRYVCLLWIIGHRRQALQDHRDCFPLYSRLCRYRFGHVFTSS